ncbi:MAG: antibiotic biosynthesis monooxygenase [Candidatus Dormibacteraeota bacterium]|nr:antibiotic biosynthesis monooxygenase [Candidatus Dormibacteraeota bacterium]
MVIVTATLQVAAEKLDEAIAISLEHVRRSRAEPGCISHSLTQDTEDPTRLTFIERWQDREALATHFVVPEAVAFARTLGALATSRTELALYEAEPFTP